MVMDKKNKNEIEKYMTKKLIGYKTVKWMELTFVCLFY